MRRLLSVAANKSYNLRMKSGEKIYIWERKGWPNYTYDSSQLAIVLAHASQLQGRLFEKINSLGLLQRKEASLHVLTEDVLETSAIEGENLDHDSVRSSIARRLGIDIGALAPTDRHVEGVVELVLDATANHARPLTQERLFGWHAAIFPTGYSGMSAISVGHWRDDASGPMQVVSGPIGKQKVHFQAPPADCLNAEIADFLLWFESDQKAPLLIKAGIAHLWFVTLHPFDDGNGRIARAIGDMALARAEQMPQRCYSLSAQIQKERKDYYDQLERTQKSTLDVTPWLAWFLGCLSRAMQGAEMSLAAALTKSRFWQHWAGVPMNARQIKILNRLLDGFEGKLTSSKWAAINKCSADTALRDINELIALEVLRKSSSGGRSTAYELEPQAPA